MCILRCVCGVFNCKRDGRFSVRFLFAITFIHTMESRIERDDVDVLVQRVDTFIRMLVVSYLSQRGICSHKFFILFFGAQICGKSVCACHWHDQMNQYELEICCSRNKIVLEMCVVTLNQLSCMYSSIAHTCRNPLACGVGDGGDNTSQQSTITLLGLFHDAKHPQCPECTEYNRIYLSRCTQTVRVRV